MTLKKWHNYYGQTVGGEGGGTLQSSQNFIDNLLVQSIQRNGINVQYLPMTADHTDQLYGENPHKVFNEAIEIEMYIESFDNFGGPEDTISFMGYTVRDEMDFMVAKSRFIEEVGYPPKEGDLIMVPLQNIKKGVILEIRFVEDEQQWYPLAKLFHYKIKCSLWDHSQEDFGTMDDNIDSINIDDLPEQMTDIETQEGDNVFIQDESDSFIDNNENDPFGSY